MSSKPTNTDNPKDAIGQTKLPMDLVPDTAIALMSLSFMEGACKYGRFNWRAKGVRASIYVSALKRHLAKWYNGEECDKKTKIPHLASVMACAAIIADAKVCGKLNDDRPPRSPVSEYIDDQQALVEHIAEIFADEDPHQYTIADSEPDQEPKFIQRIKEAHAKGEPAASVKGTSFLEFAIPHMDKCESFKELEKRYLDEIKKAQLRILGEKFWKQVGDEPLGCHPRAFRGGADESQ